MEQKMDAKTLSVIPSKASVAYRLNTYTHVLIEHKHEGMALLNGLFDIQPYPHRDYIYARRPHRHHGAELSQQYLLQSQLPGGTPHLHLPAAAHLDPPDSPDRKSAGADDYTGEVRGGIPTASCGGNESVVYSE